MGALGRVLQRAAERGVERGTECRARRAALAPAEEQEGIAPGCAARRSGCVMRQIFSVEDLCLLLMHDT